MYRLKITLTSRNWTEYVGYYDWMKVWNANLTIGFGGLEIGYSISNIWSCISLKRSGKAKAIDLDWVSFSACTPPSAMRSVLILVVMRNNVGEIETGAVTPGRPIWSFPPSELMIIKHITFRPQGLWPGWEQYDTLRQRNFCHLWFSSHKTEYPTILGRKIKRRLYLEAGRVVARRFLTSTSKLLLHWEFFFGTK